MSQGEIQAEGSSAKSAEPLVLTPSDHANIDRLPPQFRDAINQFLTGKAYRFIAKELNISIGTVKSRIHRGKLLLAAMRPKTGSAA